MKKRKNDKTLIICAKQDKIENNSEVLTPLLGVLFEQVKLQQEVRDRWFAHYISIIGAIAALATLYFEFFKDTVNKKCLFLVISLIFLFAAIIGVLFYVLYLNQRQNYKKQYNTLSLVQDMILKKELNIHNNNKNIRSFKTRRHGADFITLIIENIICSTCFTISGCFVSVAFSLAFKFIILISLLVFIISFSILIILYNKWENRNYE